MIYRYNEEFVLYEFDYDRRYVWNVFNGERNVKKDYFVNFYVDWIENNYYEYFSKINS